MRTTLNIDDELLIKAKSLAARERTSLTRIIEQGLALRLHTDAKPIRRQRPALPVHPGKGGLQPGVTDPKRHRSLLDAADEAS